LVALGVVVSVAAILLPDTGLLLGLVTRFALLLAYGVGVWHADVLSSSDRRSLCSALERAWRRARGWLFAATPGEASPSREA
jgi:hypothetical protein